ncbi:MAG: hypothetical protein NZM35_00150 [Chitinophagales bacterium]|nr:hypothetical protein [Chitinophagales bacterium]MDW8417857.1 hypothetical protein [Chitinophagales bacterium]
MRRYTTRLISACVLCFIVLAATAQNKDIEKGKEILAKAMQQTDAAKRQELVNKAIESFQKGGLKQELYAIIGDAFLEKKDYTNAANNYNRCAKPEKREGMKKIAEAYVEDAFSADDPKNEAKNLKKAMDFYTKAEAAKEGARVIGDRYYEKGFEFYNKALDYYLLGDAKVKVEQIAEEYFAKGGDNEVKAAEIYLKLKTTEGYKKAGDIYYNRNEFGKAIEAYIAGAIEEGIQKYADYLYSENRIEEADNLIMRLADAMSEKKDDEALEKLAAKTMNKGSYALASKLYDKAGNINLGDKCRAYDALVNFRLDEAKGLFNSTGDAASAKMITDNEKVLTLLRDIAENMEEIKKNAPYVTLLIDSTTGKSYASPSDQKLQEDYYKSVKDQIIKNVNDIAANYAKLNNETLKKFVRQRFLRYGAVRNILDKDTFIIRKQKQDIKAKDIVL